VNLGQRSETNKNIISASIKFGIHLINNAKNSKIIGNYIGTNKAGDDLGNGIHGVYVESGSKNFIGETTITGPTTGDANVIAFNGHDQAKVMTADERGHAIQIDGDDSTKNTIRGNVFHDNVGLSIYLNDPDHPNELPQNDVGVTTVNPATGLSTLTTLFDTDTGPNNLLNHPVLKSIDTSGGTMTWEFNTDKVGKSYTIDFYEDETVHDLGYGQPSKALTTKTITTDKLGHAEVTIPWSNGVLVSATATDSDGNTSTFSIVDSDADGLADGWETKGIDFDMDGNPEQTLAGADPQQKDLYLEVDVMDGIAWPGVNFTNVFGAIETAFANAPAAAIDNPDGSGGVNLHINPEGGFGAVPFDPDYNPVWTDFDNAKLANFGAGTQTQRDAREMAFRYAIIGQQYNGSGSSGISEPSVIANPSGGGKYTIMAGNDLFIGLPPTFFAGSPAPAPWNTVTEQDMEGTLMHEFGHDLGLLHGGTDFDNYKPNYYSIMNYDWQFPNTRFRSGQVAADYSASWTLDYSRQILPTIDENAPGTFNIGFDATKMVPVARALQTAIGTGWTFPPAPNLPYRLVPMNGAQPRVDVVWPAGKLTGRADLNFDANVAPPALSRLSGSEDWSHLLYNFRESPSYGASHGSSFNELTSDMFKPQPVGPSTAAPVVVGADAGSTPRVQTFKPDGTLGLDFLAFAPTFTGGVRVAQGDMDGDHVPDIIAAMGPGGGNVAAFSGVDGHQLWSVNPFGTTDGLNVAAGDTDGNGTIEVIVAQASGTGSTVRILSGADGSKIRDILAFATTTKGGVTLAVGDINGDGKGDIIAGMATGANPQVKVFNAADSKLLMSFIVGSPTYNGVFLAAADVNGDGKADIVAGAGGGTGANLAPVVRIYNGADPSRLLVSYLADDPAFHGGVRVATTKLVTGGYEIVTGTGPGKRILRRLFSSGLGIVWETEPFDTAVDGIFVG
jgi:hypothetical protein